MTMSTPGVSGPSTVYDVVVVGGGSSGAALAARLATDAQLQVALVEAGPADTQDRVLDIRRWWDLLGSDLDYDYAIEPQARGNGRIRHSRGRVLGGCSSHNSCIAFAPPRQDLATWTTLGATGWDHLTLGPAVQGVLDTVHLEVPGDANPFVDAVLEACEAIGLPTVDFASWDLTPGAGRFRLNVADGVRQSSSVAYLHPLEDLPANLHLLLDTPVSRVVIEDGVAVGVQTADGLLRAEREVVLCAGAIDSPRLLMLSGIGPADHLRSVGLEVVQDVPGVGAHLLDHPEGVVNYASTRPMPDSLQSWEIGVFADTSELGVPDLMLHVGSEVFDLHTADHGYPSAEHGFAFTPNVPNARSQGTVRLRSSDPGVRPSIDFAYFTDPEGYDERVMVDGVELAREIAAQAPLRDWVDRELSPGADATDRATLSEYVRRTANTVYHPAGTCRMGAVDDPVVVVDPQLRVRGVEHLRVADASIFPTMTTVNPNLTCMAIGERAAQLVQG
jgi:choline oxidase